MQEGIFYPPNHPYTTVHLSSVKSLQFLVSLKNLYSFCYPGFIVLTTIVLREYLEDRKVLSGRIYKEKSHQI
jgi:hypothetical protein